MTDTAPDVASLSFEQARDELVRVVAELEQGTPTLEQSLALWERGEALAARCEEWLLGAKRRLDAARSTGACDRVRSRRNGGLMAQAPRIVAELGRPETPEETAERKAAVVARPTAPSKTTRNLIAALLVTLAVVARHHLRRPPRRAARTARRSTSPRSREQVEAAEGRTVIVPDAPKDWRVNSAAIDGDSTARVDDRLRAGRRASSASRRASTPTPPGRRACSTARVPRAPSRSTGSSGIATTSPTPPAPATCRAPSSTQAGPDTILVYGSADEKTLEQAAAAVSAQVRELREDAE